MFLFSFISFYLQLIFLPHTWKPKPFCVTVRFNQIFDSLINPTQKRAPARATSMTSISSISKFVEHKTVIETFHIPNPLEIPFNSRSLPHSLSLSFSIKCHWKLYISGLWISIIELIATIGKRFVMFVIILSVSQSGLCDYLFRRLMKGNWRVFVLICAVQKCCGCICICMSLSCH